MNLKEYTEKAAEFKLASTDRLGIDYPQLGLQGEWGEVAEMVKKLYRDSEGMMTNKNRELIALELGDVCWYTAAIIKAQGLDAEYIQNQMFKVESDMNPGIVKATIKGGTMVGFILFHLESSDDIYNAKECLIECVIELLEQIALIAKYCGTDLIQVWQKNIEKLTDRKARGKINGSGNKR